MEWRTILGRALGFLRIYLVLLLLAAAFLFAVAERLLFGIGPTPQLPPEGYMSENRQVTLQWDPGDRGGPIALEVAVDSPDFRRKVVALPAVKGRTTHVLDDLSPGHTYYWRLVQGKAASPVATFKTSNDAIRF